MAPEGNHRRNITLKDIAASARVSLGTASKVINNQGSVGPALTERVNEAIKKYGYRPDAGARSFKKRKTTLIGLIIPSLHNGHYIQILEYTEERVKADGYSLIFANSHENFEAEVQYLKSFAEMRVAGLILSSSGINHRKEVLAELKVFDTLRIPVVTVTREINAPKVDSIMVDHLGAAHTAVDHLLALGHRRIGLINSPSTATSAKQQVEGLSRALSARGLKMNRRMIVSGGLDSHESETAAGSLLDLTPRPTALCVSSEFRVLGALKALRKRSLRVPDDVSLVGFDDAPWCEYASPRITVVAAVQREICDEALRCLYDRIDEEYDGPKRSVIISTHLIRRDSTRQLARVEGE